MKKVYCIGELLVDMVAEGQGKDLSKAVQFTKKAGGAPANVAVAVSRLGGKGGFIGAVGRDPFGEFLMHTLAEEGVDIRHAQRVQEFTTMAFVSLDSNGERDFVFSRGADKELKYDSQLVSVFGGQVLHFGAATAFLGGGLETAYNQYLKEASASGCLVSFDPNYREDLWKEGTDHFIHHSRRFLKRAHFVKMSLEEARLITGQDELEAACAFMHDLGVICVTITLGHQGTYLSVKGEAQLISSIDVSVVDTTGAGDAFVGCVLWQLASTGDPFAVINDLSRMKHIVSRGNRAGAYTVRSHGAIPALPSLADIEEFQD